MLWHTLCALQPSISKTYRRRDCRKFLLLTHAPTEFASNFYSPFSMGDQLWTTRFRPVMRQAISLLANLLGGGLLDELFAKQLIEDHHYYELLDARNRESESDRARRLHRFLSGKREPSFTVFCDVLLKVGGAAGQDLHECLNGTPSHQLDQTKPSSCSGDTSSDDEETVFVDVAEELKDLYERHRDRFETALKNYLRDVIPKRVTIVESFPPIMRELQNTVEVAKLVKISILFPNLDRQRFKQEEKRFVEYITRIMNIPKSDLELCVKDGSCIITMTVPGEAFINIMCHLGDCGILSVVCEMDAGALISFGTLPWAPIGKFQFTFFFLSLSCYCMFRAFSAGCFKHFLGSCAAK